MIFKFKENECLYLVLEILEKRNSTYGKMFKETKVSHTTLQRVLTYLILGKFIEKLEEGYVIENKGVILLEKLKELKRILV